MLSPKILVVTAGLSEPSATALLGEQLAQSVQDSLQKLGFEAQIDTVSLRHIAQEVTNHYLTGFPTGKLVGVLEAVKAADAIIAVSPTFKASYTGLFKSFWDLVDDDAMAGKPVLVAATGGTARRSLMIDTSMRPLFSYFKAQVVPTGVFAATDDFGGDTSMQGRILRASEELAQVIAWKSGAQPAAVGAIEDVPVEMQEHPINQKVGLSVTPFEQLLKGA